MQTEKISYKRHRFPPQIIAHVDWLYARFNLSLCEVEELMLERGVDVSYETIRRLTVKFGPLIAHVLRRRQPHPGDVWYLDEVVVKIVGRSYWLWRAVDQHGVVLEEILQSRRDKRAAKRLFIKLMKRWGFVGFVAQIGLMSVFPLPQTDLAYGYGTGYAKNCEAVEDRGADLDLCNLTLEVARRKALAKQFYTMHLRFDAAPAVISGQVSPQSATQVL